MIRFATVEDAEQLEKLNNEFNGKGETSLENIKKSLAENKQELIIVAEEAGILVAFLCVQLKKSFCYDEYMPEISELYVNPKYRRRGISQTLMSFAEKYLAENIPYSRIELLTNKKNLVAQAAYTKFGLCEDSEMHLSKRAEK